MYIKQFLFAGLLITTINVQAHDFELISWQKLGLGSGFLVAGIGLGYKSIKTLIAIHIEFARIRKELEAQGATIKTSYRPEGRDVATLSISPNVAYDQRRKLEELFRRQHDETFGWGAGIALCLSTVGIVGIQRAFDNS